MASTTDTYTVGIDFGSLSGRAVIVRVRDGHEVADAVYAYPHAVMDTALASTGEALPPEFALQDPDDYVDVLRHAVPEALAKAGIDPSLVIGVGTDFTACTMVPTTADGTPLSRLADFAGRPHAYVKLWKHHAAQPQADRINALARERGEAWLPRYGGFISSEWEFAKGLELLESDPGVYAATQCWVEAADWIVWQLTGRYVRNACTAGYKGIYQDGAYPSRDFLAALNPGFADFVDTKVAHEIGQLGDAAGRLTPQAAGWTGLPAGIVVAVGNVDAHVTVPAAKATRPGHMVAIMGTSTCHILNGDALAEVPGMCGVVEGGVSPGHFGYEAGQSGVGDIFNWFVTSFAGGDVAARAAAAGTSVHQYLTDLSEAKPIGSHGLIALDWESGNRSVLVDHELSGLIVGLTLTTPPEDVYRALVEATAFGTRTIVETFIAAGVPVEEFIAAGGLLRNTALMQIYSDVLAMPISVVTSAQGPALGSAIHAAVAAGAYPDIDTAAEAMGSVERDVYCPRPEASATYDLLYREYQQLHDYFGRGGTDVMRRLKALRRTTLANRKDTRGTVHH